MSEGLYTEMYSQRNTLSGVRNASDAVSLLTRMVWSMDRAATKDGATLVWDTLKLDSDTDEIETMSLMSDDAVLESWSWISMTVVGVKEA